MIIFKVAIRLWADLWPLVTLSNAAPKAREAFRFSCHYGDKIHKPAQTVTESVYYHRGNQGKPEPTPGGLGSASNQGDGAAGGNLMTHVWVVSERGSGQETLAGLVCIAQGGELSRAGFCPDKAKVSQNQR